MDPLRGDPQVTPSTACSSRPPAHELNGDNWLRIGRAWSKPICSPTRSTIQSGRYGRITGIGTNVGYGSTEHILDVTDPNLPAKDLGGYETAVFGKTS